MTTEAVQGELSETAALWCAEIAEVQRRIVGNEVKSALFSKSSPRTTRQRFEYLESIKRRDSKPTTRVLEILFSLVAGEAVSARAYRRRPAYPATRGMQTERT